MVEKIEKRMRKRTEQMYLTERQNLHRIIHPRRSKGSKWWEGVSGGRE